MMMPCLEAVLKSRAYVLNPHVETLNILKERKKRSNMVLGLKSRSLSILQMLLYSRFTAFISTMTAIVPILFEYSGRSTLSKECGNNSLGVDSVRITE
mmetsp:Transcript_1646/g.2429  ORF Transcript_1646/g.2429 Transcript_1646/m.2429 type:complete len:98 (-) Transcript_1646:43-336(-)